MEGEEFSHDPWPRGGGRGPTRKKPGKKRPQRGAPDAASPRSDRVYREHLFQDIEGLLRQIREQAEESARWTDEELNEFVASVTAFTRSLEQQEGNSIPPRLQNDYQRLRDKLAHALRS